MQDSMPVHCITSWREATGRGTTLFAGFGVHIISTMMALLQAVYFSIEDMQNLMVTGRFIVISNL